MTMEASFINVCFKNGNSSKECPHDRNTDESRKGVKAGFFLET